MITTIDITLLDAELRAVVLAKYRVALMDPSIKLTMLEAAWLYGYTYQTLRHYCSSGWIKTSGKGRNRRITHAAMRTYLRNKKREGTPRKALKGMQQQLA
ncbi:MAG TPA: hypothetical protein PKY96_18620 [Flavobacteriales bacterium]|nr:hypothetical protein [Flavobacteriales bacterium]